MAKSKWPDVKQKLSLVEAWARDGLIEQQIAKNLGVSKATMQLYKKEHSDFLAALKKGKDVVDVEVENALLKRAMGYSFDEVTKESRFNPNTGEYEPVITKIVTKEVQPDVTAQIFWLKNRKPDQWRDTKDLKHSGEISIKKLEDFF